MNLNNIRIVLVEPRGAGNIGSCARALKNMGLHRLVLVNPIEYLVDEGLKMAVDARDILEKAKVCSSLEEALQGTTLSIGTTRRRGKLRNPVYSISTIAEKVSAVSERNKVAFVFGREDKGLLTKELKLCTLVSYIQTNESFPSLNLAQAVMITCYELFILSRLMEKAEPLSLAKFEDVENFYRQLEATLARIGFLNAAYPTSIMIALRRLFGKADLEPREVKILRGILRQIDWYAGAIDKKNGMGKNEADSIVGKVIKDSDEDKGMK